jgi:hypothetical protein
MVFAQLQTWNFGQNSGLRYRKKTAKAVMVEIEEENSKLESQRV